MITKDISTQPTDAKEQYDLGVEYMIGEGRIVPQDDEQAFKWFTEAADQGYSPAQYHLGTRYSNGRGVPQDSEQAIKWFTKSAEQGDVNAQYHLDNLISP